MRRRSGGLGDHVLALMPAAERGPSAAREGGRDLSIVEEHGEMKSLSTYWNPLDPENFARWEAIEGADGNLKQLTLAEDPATGDYTRLTWFRDGYSTEAFGSKSHDYPEEIFVVRGELYDAAFDLWLTPGCYASRPPGEVHGPFTARGDVVIYESSYPSQSMDRAG